MALKVVAATLVGGGYGTCRALTQHAAAVNGTVAGSILNMCTAFSEALAAVPAQGADAAVSLSGVSVAEWRATINESGRTLALELGAQAVITAVLLLLWSSFVLPSVLNRWDWSQSRRCDPVIARCEAEIAAMRSTLAAFESRLQRIGVMAESEDAPSVFVKPTSGDDSNSGSHSGSPVKTIERGLELLLQQRNESSKRSQVRHTVATADRVTSSQCVGAADGLPKSTRSMSTTVHNHVEHVVDAAAMLARAKHAEDDADPPRNSSPVERAHNSEFYEPRALSPPSSAVKPRSRAGSPFMALDRVQQGTVTSSPSAVGGRLREHRRVNQQRKAQGRLSDEVGSEEERVQSPLKNLKQQAQVEMTWESDDDDDDDRARLRPHSAAYRETNAGKMITTYAEHSARQEVPSICGNDSDIDLDKDEDNAHGEDEDEDEDQDAATAFENRLAAGKERRSSSPGSPMSSTEQHLQRYRRTSIVSDSDVESDRQPSGAETRAVVGSADSDDSIALSPRDDKIDEAVLSSRSHSRHITPQKHGEPGNEMSVGSSSSRLDETTIADTDDVCTRGPQPMVANDAVELDGQQAVSIPDTVPTLFGVDEAEARLAKWSLDGAKLSELTTLAQASVSSPRRAGEAMTGILEYKGRQRWVMLQGKSLSIYKTKASSEDVLVSLSVAGASVERDDVFIELELPAASDVHLRAPSLPKARAWELAIRQSC